MPLRRLSAKDKKRKKTTISPAQKRTTTTCLLPPLQRLLSLPLARLSATTTAKARLLVSYRGGLGGRAPNSGTCTLIAESAGKWGTKERRRWARVPAPTCTFGVQVHDFRPEPKVHMKLPPCAIHVYYHHLLRNHIVSATNASRNRFVDRQLRETSPCRALA